MTAICVSSLVSGNVLINVRPLLGMIFGTVFKSGAMFFCLLW
mgnify:CR=1 FL=1